MAVDVVVLDVNETLSDLTPLRARFAEVGLAPEQMATWFAGVLRDGFALTAVDDFRPFAAIARGNLRSLLTEPQIDHVLSGFRELELHDDVIDGMRGLVGAGFRLVTLTNGAAAMSEQMFARAGTLDLLEQRLSVEDVERWKPHPLSYEYAARSCGVALESMALVATHPWDVQGAQRVGMLGVWVERGDAEYPDYLPAPDLAVTDLRDLPAALSGAQHTN